MKDDEQESVRGELVLPAQNVLQGIGHTNDLLSNQRVAGVVQYSSGSKIQVDERLASVITQILTPVILSVYTDISRNPCSSES